MGYTDRVERTGTSRTARERVEKVHAEVIKEAVETSVALQVGRVAPMTQYQERIKVLSAFAGAYWLNGANQAEKDSAKKQTTKIEWDNVYLTPEEIAVMVAVPDAWMADSDIAWEEIKDELKRAFAKAIDLAIFFGVSEFGALPATFGNGIVPDAIAAGNVIAVGSQPAPNDDLYGTVLALGKLLASQGYNTTGFLADPVFSWTMQEQRDGYGRPLYQPSLTDDLPGKVLGRTYREVINGAWDSDEALLVGGEWDKLRIGVRQDMTFDLFDQGVITDADGAVIYNTMQQDGKVLRAVMRLGYATPNPLKVLGGEFPFGVITPDPATT